MAALTIDTLAISQILRKRGFTEEQATGVVEALREIESGSLATKDDLKNEMVRLEATIEKTSAYLKIEILRWLLLTQVGVIGLIVGALKVIR
jgi:hypothetical protein